MHYPVRAHLTAGIALAGAGAVALSSVSPVLPVSADVQIPAAVRSADVQLLASPFDEYLAVVQNSIGNLGALAQQAVNPSPLPITLAILANQLNNAQAIGGGAVRSTQQFVDQVFNELPAETVQAISQFLSGDPAGSAETVVAAFTRFLNQSLGPILGTTRFVVLDTIERTGDAVFAAADNAFILVRGVTDPAYALVLSSGQAAQNVIDAAEAADFLGVLGQTAAAPAVVADGLLNGTPEYGGLLSPIGIAPSGDKIRTGPIGALFTYRNRIAGALSGPSTLNVESREAADPGVSGGPTVTLSAPATENGESQRRLPRVRELREGFTGNLVASRSQTFGDDAKTKAPADTPTAADGKSTVRPVARVDRPIQNALRNITKQVTKALGARPEKQEPAAEE